MRNIIKKLLGIDELEKQFDLAVKAQKQAEAAASAAKQEHDSIERRLNQVYAEKKKETLTPKEKATAKQEPWVGVLETHINKDNIRNGFFEIDWNEFFIIQLKQAGYGEDGDPEEEIVDRWFRDLTYQLYLESELAANSELPVRGNLQAGSLDVNRAIKTNKPDNN